MTPADPRSEKVAVVPDDALLGLLPTLREAGYGMMQLPPTGLAADTAAEWLEQTAEQIAEYRRNGYRVVLAARGSWSAGLDTELERLGMDPLPELDLPVSAEPPDGERVA